MTGDRIKVLYLDDEQALLELTKLFLEKENGALEVITSDSPEEIIDNWETYRETINVIVSDYQMPNMNGTDFLEVLRKEKQSDIPFIIFTGKGREEVAIKALNLGADRYIQKGSDIKSQYSVLAQAIIQEANYWRIKKENLQHIKENAQTLKILETSWNAIPDIIGIQDNNYNIIRYNASGYRFLGMTLAEVLGKKCYELIGRKTNCDICATKEVYKTKKPAEVEKYVKEVDKWFNVRAYPIFDENGEITNIIEHLRDITKRKQTEIELREKNELYETMVQNHPAGIAIIGSNYTIEFVNDKLTDLTGYNKKELVGKDFRLFLSEDSKEFVAEKYLGRREGKKLASVYEFNLLSKENKEIAAEMHVSIFKIEGKIKSLAQILDISKTKENEERWKYALEGSRTGVWDWNIASGKVYFSTIWKKMLGFNESEIKNDLEEWDKRVHPEDREYVFKVLNAHLAGETPYYEVEHRIQTRDGSYKWILDRGKVFEWDNDNKPIRAVGTHIDIDEVKRQREREGFLFDLLNHDLKNKNTVIRGYLDLLDEVELNKSAKKIIQRTLEVVNRTASQLEKIHMLRGLEEYSDRILNLNEILTSVIDQNKAAATEANISIHYTNHNVQVKAGILLQEAFQNLIENAIRHSECSKIIVEVEEHDGLVLVKIIDDGKGIDSDLVAEIFHNGNGDGDGTNSCPSCLGLRLVRKLIYAYKGTISIEKDNGTIVTIKLRSTA